ncbi:MAG: hypothetical protein ACFFBD_06710 [Candidatus Hodarchaeota archaeon]
MIQSYLILDMHTHKILHKYEFVEKSLDEDLIGNFLNSMKGILSSAFGEQTIPSEFSIRQANTFYTFRWGAHLVAVLLSNLESKLYTTRLTETIHEIETGLGDEIHGDTLPESVLPRIAEVVLKNFKDLVFLPVDDIGNVDQLLKAADDYYIHINVEAAANYEAKRSAPALRNFVNSYDTITFEALDELTSILRSDLITVSDLQTRMRLLNSQDLALTLRQLLRLNIVNCYTRPKG